MKVNLKRRLVQLVIMFAVSLLATSRSHAACDAKFAKPITDKVTSEIGIMIQFTKASCVPTSDGSKCSILCVSDLRISGLNRDIVLTFITASAGKKMREAGIGRFSTIVFADRSLLEIRKALKISADRASTLQQGFQASSEKPEVMSARVGREYVEIDVPK